MQCFGTRDRPVDISENHAGENWEKAGNLVLVTVYKPTCVRCEQ